VEIDRELETYRRELPRLLEEGREGRFVLIHGDRLDSFWPDDGTAYGAGCERFGVSPFPVKQVLRDERAFTDLPG
jgi:hypothetical protein